MKPNKLSWFRALFGARGADGPATVILAATFVSGLALVLFLGPGAAVSSGAAQGNGVGKVAERDVIADKDVRWIDEKATALRLEAEERLVLPIFVMDDRVAERSLERFRAFQDLVLSLSSRPYAPDSLYYQVQSQYPGLLPRQEIVALAAYPLKAQVFSNADAVLRRLFEEGVAALPSSGLERYNPDYIELRRKDGGREVDEEVPFAKLVTAVKARDSIDADILARRLSQPMAGHVAALASAFIAENAFFDAALSQERLDKVKARLDPVVRTIARGDRILRKGFIVTETDFARLQAAIRSYSRADWGRLLGDAGLYALFFALAFFLLRKEVSGAALGRKEFIVCVAGAFVYLAAAVLIARFGGLEDPSFVAIFLPGALFTLLMAILVGQRFALLYGLVLSLEVLLATGLDARVFALAFISAEAGALVVRNASSRIDLVRAGAVLALVEGLAAAIVSIPQAQGLAAILGPAGAGSVNGFLCGVLSLALIPVVEQALNAPTRFRLMELSDLNAPILKRLLTVAPGTYSHSVTVAHLAESACREIGADPLLARVGAYYHDIGKIEQPEYFVENQAGYNKHDEINPRLSATVIRSHVKLGVEKARALGLPEEVVAIVGEHHGNGRISFFYNQALKEDPEAKAEDFCYPGQVPGSREAAVVMLADTVEAASRTLKKPTLSRLEDFIKELVMEKVRTGQLDRCDLTFKDLETIRGSFARILAGHFHSRIEYPKMKGEAR
jgi:putative nucleotidyltransferase with HDIG domain